MRHVRKSRGLSDTSIRSKWFFEMGLQIAAWVIWGNQIAEKIRSLPRLPLPRIVVLILDGIPDENFLRPARIGTCFVQHWKDKGVRC